MAANSVLTKYQNLANQLQSELYSKPGATTSGSEPSRTDVQKEIQLIKTKAGLRRVLAEQRAADWYGTPTTKPAAKEEKREGVVSKIINVLSTPLYGIVGAAETALGKGTRKGLIENIKSNIKEKGTFGDLLRSYNAPRALAMPLGFALDVMFDPVNWTIAGTAALIPKVAVGAARAGVKGAELGIKSGLAKKVATVGKYTPVVSRTEKYQKFADEAVKLSDDYYKAINSDAVDVLRKTIDNPDFRRRAAESLEQFLNRTKRGQKVLEMTKYSPKDWYEATRSLAIEEKTMVDKLKKIMANEPLSPAEMEELPGVVRGGKVFLPKIIKEMAEAEDLASGGYKIAKADNWAEAGRRLAGESEIDKALKAELLEKFREITAVDRTGSAALDKFAHIFRTKLKIGDVNVGEKIADAYNIFISAFKGSVIGLSPAAYTRAAIGNTAFAQMAGINIVNPNFRKYVVGAWGLVRGKGGAFEKQMLDNFITDPNWQKFLENYPSIFSRVFGYHPAFLRGRYSMEQIGDKFLEVLKKQGGGLDVISFGKEKGEVMGAFNRSLRAFKGGGKEAVNIRRKLGGVASQIAKESGVAGDVGGTTFFSSEIYQGAFKKFVNDLAAQGAAGNRFAKFLHGYFTKPMDAYELIDQSFKLGTTLYLSQVGISRNELMMIKNFMKLAPEDLARVAGKDLYKFLPDAATRSAGEIYMNYGAMPGFVKIMRTMPFFGAPFISFSYAMATKLGKTFAYNPAIFNKINFLLQEISGPRTPLEKKTLQSPYYNYLNRPGVVKLNYLLPFLGDNPVYLNAVNMLPYYTLNIFQPSEREYIDPAMDRISKIRDRSPFFQTPEGQVVWDYFIQPMIIRDSNPPEAPIGLFGQPLYPESAGALEKYLTYPTRDIAGALIPPISGAAGFLTSELPDRVKDYLPHYRWRQVAYALQGKGATGIPSKEPALQRTLRAMSSILGFPVYQLELRFQNKK